MLRHVVPRAALRRALSSSSPLDMDIAVGRLAEDTRSSPQRPVFGPGGERAGATPEAISLRERYTTARGRHIARSAVAAMDSMVEPIDRQLRALEAQTHARFGKAGSKLRDSGREVTVAEESPRDVRLRHSARLSLGSLRGLLMKLPAETPEGDDLIRTGRVHHGRSPEEISSALLELAKERKAQSLADLDALSGPHAPALRAAVMRRKPTEADAEAIIAAIEAGDADVTSVCSVLDTEEDLAERLRVIAENDVPGRLVAASRTVPNARPSWAGAVRAEFPHTISAVSFDSMVASDFEYPVERAARAVLSFPVSGLGLSDAARARFIELVGPRYDGSNGTVKFAVLQFRDRAENLTQAFWQLRECVIEAQVADADSAPGASTPVDELFPDGDPAPRPEAEVRAEHEAAIRAYIGDEAYNEVDPHPYAAPAIVQRDIEPFLGTAREIIAERRRKHSIADRVVKIEERADHDIDASDTEDDERF